VSTPIQIVARRLYTRRVRRGEEAIRAVGITSAPARVGFEWTAWGMASQVILVDRPLLCRLCDPLIFGRPKLGPRKEALIRNA
jgi:hypothetical protein